MKICRTAFLIVCVLSTVVLSAQQGSEQNVVTVATEWLQADSAGDKVALNKVTDPLFLATTPGGDVITKIRLIPDDDKPVQSLPQLRLQSPIVRIYGETAVLMSRLSAPGGAGDLNGTFVFVQRNGIWRLVALHLSPQK